MSDEPKPSIGSRIKSLFIHNGGESPAAPTNSTFEKLASAMPAMFRQLRDRKRKAQVTTLENALKSGVKLPCCVCGKHFGSPKVTLGLEAQKRHVCPVCKRALACGFTAFITIGEKPRFILAKFPDATPEQQAQVAGKIIVLTEKQMDGRMKAAKQP